jgi:hypothetical protein
MFATYYYYGALPPNVFARCSSVRRRDNFVQKHVKVRAAERSTVSTTDTKLDLTALSETFTSGLTETCCTTTTFLQENCAKASLLTRIDLYSSINMPVSCGRTRCIPKLDCCPAVADQIAVQSGSHNDVVAALLTTVHGRESKQNSPKNVHEAFALLFRTTSVLSKFRSVPFPRSSGTLHNWPAPPPLGDAQLGSPVHACTVLDIDNVHTSVPTTGDFTD